MTTYDKLRHLVVSGQVASDQRVSEASLAQRLSVSRTPIREALQRLAGDGLVQGEGRGVKIRVLLGEDLDHVYRVRAAMEGFVGEAAAERLAAGQVAPAEIRSLEEAAAMADVATQAGDLDEAIAQNRAFHRGVTLMAANPAALEILERLWDQILLSTRSSLSAPERPEVVRAEHELLLRCLGDGDRSGAGAAARHHVLATLAALRVAVPPINAGR